ncbi:MAG: prepilin-type N-terminal cleavage/methylation domain-containing protein [Oligoflexia bacterium]|nr:prepilin-type N-terminal cleavage/methylation domain-containing protein [Oligoflexia bacterium]
MKSRAARPSSLQGFTLTEVLVSSALLGLLVVTSMQLLVKVDSESSVMQRSQQARIELLGVIDSVGALLFNAANISPREGLNSDLDRRYKGLTAYDSASATPFCKHAAEGGRETFSIVRLTHLKGKIFTEVTLRPWNEATPASNPLSKLRLSFHNHPSYPFQVTDTTPKLERELLLIDGENLASRRYRVTHANHVVTDKDPYSDVAVAGSTFIYTELSVDLPALPNGAAQTPEPLQFISGSTAYAAATSILCVSASDGKLITRDEATGEDRTLYDPAKDKFKITSFAVTYHGTTLASVLQSSLYAAFPTSLTAIDCVNTARVSLELAPLAGPTSTPIRLQKQVLLNNFNLRRPASCN